MSVYKSLMWKYIERCAALGISLILSIFLSRLLSTTDYGTIALINVFIAFANTLVQSGLNTSLIQKKIVDDTDWATGLITNVILSVVLYLILFFAAPFIAAFYMKEALTSVIRAFSISIILGAFNSIQVAYASRKMQFKLMSICTILSSSLSGIIGIILAYNSYNIWALVWQQISYYVILCTTMKAGLNWKFQLNFSFYRLKTIFSYSWKLTASSLIDTAYNEIFSLFIGKLYSANTLAYYNKGQSYPKLLGQLTSTSIGSVVLPLYSKAQDEQIRLKEMVRKSIKLSSYIFFPVMFGLAAVAEPFIIVLFSDKWAPSIPYVRIFCMAFLFYPVNMANVQALNGIGRSDIFLKINIIKKAISLSIMFTFIKLGVLAIAYGYAFSTIINLVINIVPCQKYLKYSFIEQMKDILPALLLSVFMFIAVNTLNYLPFSSLAKSLLQVLTGLIIYISGSIITKRKEFYSIVDIVKSVSQKGK